MTSKSIPTQSEVSARIQEFERRYPVFTICDGGVSLWRLMRFETAAQLQNLKLQRAPIPRSQLLISLPRAAWQFATARREYSYIGKTSKEGLRDRRNGKYRDIFFDDLIDAVPGGALFASFDNAGFAMNSRHMHRKPIFDDTSVVVGSAILGRTFGKRSPSKSSTRLATMISSDLNLPEFTPRQVQQKYDVYRYRAMIYRNVLRRFGVKIVLAANTGLFPLIAAARSLGIPYTEIQHGDFDVNHPDSIPASALDTDVSSLLLPDRLAVFGQHEVEHLSGTALGELGRLRAVGSPAIASGRSLREKKFRSDPKQPIIIFTSQSISQEQVAQFILDFLTAYSGSIRFIIRLHPGYVGDGDTYRAIARRDPRLEVMEGGAMPPTHEMIALSDLHLSISSICHYESLGIGTPTAVLGMPGHTNMTKLMGTGAAPLIESPEQLAHMIRLRNWAVVTSDQSNYFFRPGYITNMLELMREWDLEMQ
jgi:hypothetical protein